MRKILSFIKGLFSGKKEKYFKSHKDHIGCNFGMKEFNKTKRSKEFVEELNLKGKGKGKSPKDQPPSQPPPVSQPPSTPSGGCIFLAFEGGVVSGTNWNLSGDLIFSYSGLSDVEKQEIIDSVIFDYAKFNVLVTVDEAIYNSYSIGKKTRCLITETYEWYGNGAGGVSFIGSYSWTILTPCFVFSSLLGYNIKYIKEAISHEVGHSLGLYHQAKYDQNCVLISEYNRGENGEAPIMGVGYYQPDVHWWIGPTPYGCNEIQNDENVITALLGLKI